MPRKLIIHIGTHKTGTTYLQRVLSMNRAYLLSLGVDYPKSAGEAHHRCAQELKRGTHTSPGSFTRLLERIRNSDAECFIVSSEGFDNLSHELIGQLKQTLTSADLEVLVVFTIRNQCDLIESSLRGTKMYRRLVRDREAILIKSMNHPSMRVFELFRNWSGLFGEKNVSIGIYEQQQDIVSDFFRLARLPHFNDIRLQRPASRENSSMDVRFALLLQSILKRSPQQNHSMLFEQVFPDLRKAADSMAGEFRTDRRSSFFSSSDREKIVREFYDENRRFSQNVIELPDVYFDPQRNLDFVNEVPAGYAVALFTRLLTNAGEQSVSGLRAA
ncbi:MAG: hypothetical protein AAF456_00870 [Planctomycetota bacterium]